VAASWIAPPSPGFAPCADGKMWIVTVGMSESATSRAICSLIVSLMPI